ncbi:HD-GYP domain-containing protein [Desulfitobacterium metallireducens]|uniref:Phosphohydrolase n=1 Tax=Desulfitobacterium metallireducens DSM 15288 TaxID=871968 RepID=W0ECE0_9FIRM|nr:HD-GYP domain-containing protein [Desulfitobacterium metallireducens]AHF07163.1 phosphohydrolase [Desulfitobacterium metallireducens DSM 15288]
MRLVNINYVEEGEILARPIVSPFGNVLLQAGITLIQNYINRLSNMGVDVIFIEDDQFEDVEVYTGVSAQTRKAAYSTLQNLTNFVKEGQLSTLGADKIQALIEQMIDDLMASHDILSNIVEIRDYDNYTYRHSINTTVIALLLGIAMGWDNSRLLEFGMGVIMHDIGKMKIPQEILNKKGPLTESEFIEIKKHAEYGFELLRKNQDFSILSAHIAFQHQEKWDGTGYPRGLKGTEIHEFGRVAAVADVYEALTSKRVYREAMQPHEAFEYVVSQRGTHFEPRVLDIFSKSIAVYPSGSGVKLSNGQRGNVIRQNPAFPTRPYVRVTHEGDIRLLRPIDYNLAEHPSLMIVGVVNK